GRIFDILNEAGEDENLAFANELLGDVGIKLLQFLRERTGQLGLLDSLHVDRLVWAQTQHLKVIKRQRQDADEQHRAEHQPKNAEAADEQAVEELIEIRRHVPGSI